MDITISVTSIPLDLVWCVFVGLFFGKISRRKPKTKALRLPIL